MPHEFTWKADPGSWRWRLDVLEQLLGCYQQALSHKLRNQLITIGGLTNLLQLKLDDQLNDETRGYLTRLTNAVGKTGELLGTFADLGRMCRDLEPSCSVALTEAVREAAAEVKMLYPQRPIEYDLQMMMPAVHVPRRPLHLALVHLLRLAGETAGKECTAPLKVTAETTRDDDGRDGVALHIAETGRSLSEEELALLFKRLCSGAVAADKGLDLFLVRQAAALWGGGVRVQSESGLGTTFTLLFGQTITG
jgi:signal transduction histidine kinase